MLCGALNIHAASGARWRFDRIYYAPTGTRNSMPKHFLRYAGGPAKFSHRVRLASIFQDSICAAIVSLLLHCRPSAVAGEIAFFIVDALDREPFLRPLAHVIKKAVKTAFPIFSIKPSVTHGNSISGIVLESRAVTVGAAINHSIVRTGCKRTAAASCVPVCRVTYQASARSRFAAPKTRAVHYSFVAAVATAIPKQSPAVIRASQRYDCKDAASFSCHVDLTAHQKSPCKSLEG